MKAALLGNRNRHKTLVDQFAYPKNGTGALYERLARKIQSRGGRILLGVKVKEILTESFRVSAVTDTEGRRYEADQIVSTMPITHLVEGLTQKEPAVLEAARKLYFRNTTLVYLEIDQADVFPDNWIYVHSPEVRHGRITNFRNWCSSLYGNRSTTILCMEYWSFDDEPFWKLDDAALKKLAIEEIGTLDLLSSDTGVLNASVVRIPKCYPVYETGYKEHLQPVTDYLDAFHNLHPIGRYGAFKYNNQDHSILMGILVARQLATGVDQQLWTINTDVDYQEKTEIYLSGYQR